MRLGRASNVFKLEHFNLILKFNFLFNYLLVSGTKLGRGGGQDVSVLDFYSDDPSSNPADVYRVFLYNLRLKRTKINKRGWG